MHVGPGVLSRPGPLSVKPSLGLVPSLGLAISRSGPPRSGPLSFLAWPSLDQALSRSGSLGTQTQQQSAPIDPAVPIIPHVPAVIVASKIVTGKSRGQHLSKISSLNKKDINGECSKRQDPNNLSRSIIPARYHFRGNFLSSRVILQINKRDAR